MFKRNLSLKQVWLTLILLASVVPLSIASIWFAQMSYDTKLSDSLALEKQKNLSLRNNIESEIHRIKTVLLNKADPLSFLMADEVSAKDLTLVNVLLKQVTRREQLVRGIILLSTDSKVLAADTPYLNMATSEPLPIKTLQSIGKSWGLIDVFEQPEVVIPSRGGVYISSPEIYSDTVAFTISVPVGKPVEAVLVAKVDFNFLWQQVAQHGDMESGARDYLIDSRGSLVSNIKGSEYQRGDALTHLGVVSTALGHEVWPGDKAYVGVLKQVVYGSVVNIPALNWSLISEVNASQVTQPILDALYKALLFIVPSMAIFIGFIWRLTRKTLAPIQQLYTAVDQVAKGQYKQDLSLSGISELDALSLNFNKMTEARQQADETLRASKRQLQNVINASRLGYWDWNYQTHEHTVNDIWLEMLGLSRGDIKKNYDDWSSLIHPDDADRVHAVIRKNQDIGGSYTVEFRMRHSDGHWVWIEGSGGVVEYDEINNVPLRMCGTHQDISHRKELENEVYASLQHLKLYREQAPLAAIEWNVDFQVEGWNQAAENMFGYTLDEIKGRDFNIMIPGNAKINVSEVWQGLINQTGGSKNINENLTKDGRIILCEWHNKAIVDESGKVVGVAAVVLDITQLKEQQVQLQRAQKMDALGKLVGGIAHDYNNMLGVILGYTDLMKMKFSTVDGLAKYIDHIAQAGERGRKLTQRMLNFSKKESSGAEATSINQVLNSQKDLLSKAITALIHIHYDLSQSDWLVWVDSSELEDVLLNVSINAQHAMVNGGSLTFKTQTVHLETAEAKFLDLAENDYLKLTVRDTGCGMGDELISKIFDPFFSTKGTQGTGLGLSQVYGFMERSGGAVKVYSELGLGTEFSFYFPRYRGVEENEAEQDMPALEGMQGDGETILVVDDEPALRELAAEMLRLAGYRVLMASDGGEALDILASHSVGLVLSDVIMPNMDGYQLAKHIETLYPEVKIQLASGYSDNRHIEANNDRLHKALLNKPYSSLELMSRISHLLAGFKNE